ncbi:transcriptional regulator [Paucilactobacillus oligofermentans DSM 15707 = LMG 22743]|uniref:UPF0122 protein FC70_GL001697 n=1 Tax=Paucilactobacillus oligofermentans DSM 15707 = LMG 22743 TaxID=1423778 RepID=A0A0R1RD45_9LACO|nr:putative DNA-binding protein [Paucilactobacillus oligofermentans]KRL54895.1 transcriptional regulator [Paucilactobacillus oligofermentans DSM 15707 = LMG 22743]CUS26190.1 Putative signal recognition particle operon regulator YlxM [Paucilactobacillus oligofermentans DSM 15707 = LMG 22743]
MEIEKNEQINSLFEFYQSLLTQKQNDYIQLYYADDYSLGEIAEEFDVSRQAVYDNIKRTVTVLLDYEEKLHLYADFTVRNNQVDKIKTYIDNKYPDDNDLKSLIERLENLEEE